MRRRKLRNMSSDPQENGASSKQELSFIKKIEQSLSKQPPSHHFRRFLPYWQSVGSLSPEQERALREQNKRRSLDEGSLIKTGGDLSMDQPSMEDDLYESPQF